MKYLCLLITILVLQGKLSAQEFMHEQIFIYYIGPTDRPPESAHIFMKKSNTLMHVGFNDYHFSVRKKIYALIRDYITTYHNKYSDTAKPINIDRGVYMMAFCRDTVIVYEDALYNPTESQKYFKELREVIPDTRANRPLIYFLSVYLIRDKENTSKVENMTLRKTLRAIKKSHYDSTSNRIVYIAK